MGSKSSLLSFRTPTPAGVRPFAKDRKPTHDELEFVRAMARLVAQELSEQERAGAINLPEQPSCE